MTTPVLRSILYVDDDSYQQIIFKLAVGSMDNITVHTAYPGMQALSMAEDFMPDLLLVNVRGTRMDGPDTLEGLRTIPGMAHVPVIFMASQAAEHEIAYYCALGAIGVICKPFEPFELMRQVKRLWANNEWPTAAMVQQA